MLLDHARLFLPREARYFTNRPQQHADTVRTHAHDRTAPWTTD
ncbi:hypothetical protein ABH928_004860 [Streptacidiphilus sp. MAP5-3]